MKTSEKGRRFIEGFEARRLKAYQDSVGVWTIGIGHTAAAGPPIVRPGMVINETECDNIFARDLGPVENTVNSLVKVELTQSQFDALVSLVFNIGGGAFAKSTLLKRVNARQFDLVPAEFMKWTKAGGHELNGLVRRRRGEAAMWRNIDREAPINHDESRKVPDQPKPKKTITQSKEGNAAILTGALATGKTVTEVADNVSSANDTVSGLMEMVSKPSFWILILIVVAAGAIWYWRKRKIDEEAA